MGREFTATLGLVSVIWGCTRTRASVRIEDPSVSRRHAVLRAGETLEIEDLAAARCVTGTPRRQQSWSRALPILTVVARILRRSRLLCDGRSAKSRA
jgi:hypothetical protein